MRVFRFLIAQLAFVIMIFGYLRGTFVPCYYLNGYMLNKQLFQLPEKY